MSKDHYTTGEAELARLADAVEAVVEQLRLLVDAARPREISIDLGAPVARTAGPALSDPIGYAIVQQDGPHLRLPLDYVEPSPELAAELLAGSDQRVVAVYDLPREVRP